MPSNGKPRSPAKLIDAKVKELADWRGNALSRMRRLIKQAVPEVVEEMKWRKPSNPTGVPVWSHHGIICTGETYKDKVKLTFVNGASLKDPAGLFNASFGGSARRAIDLREGDEIDERAFVALVRAADALNASSGARSRSSNATPERSTPTTRPPRAAQPKLLAGGNPQIAKGEGDAPVQAYIGAMPGWKSDVGRRLDALIMRTVPKAHKAVKWNSPFYGMEGQGWFLSFHCFAKYVKVTFFRGASLRPLPPIESKDANTRYFHIHEGDDLDQALVASWVRQAAALPGWVTSDIRRT